MPDEKEGGGILGGLIALVEKLVDLERRGGRLHRGGERRSDDERVGVSYEWQVRLGAEEEARRQAAAEAPAKRASVQSIREPMVDVFEEGEKVLVVAQLPGVPAEAIEVDLEGDILTIDADHDGLRYHKEILLPRAFAHADRSFRNGVLQIGLEPEAS